MIALLALILGLMAGFWAKDVYVTIHDLKDRLKADKDYKAAGVVKPGVQPVARQIDLTAKSGVIRRPSVEQSKIANLEERERRLRSL
jgi:hypothetical protein